MFWMLLAFDVALTFAVVALAKRIGHGEPARLHPAEPRTHVHVRERPPFDFERDA